jgi:hypothetical protein
MASIPASVAAFRTDYRGRIGPRYRGWAHFVFTTTASLAVIGIAASRVHDVRPIEWLAVPLTFLFANAGEYFGHRGPMHRPRRGLALVYERHARQHHRFFTNEAMAYESPRDFKMVLFPPVMFLFFLGVLATPVALALFALAGSNVGWLYVAVAMGYFLTYEWLHFAYHLPEDGWVGRLPFMARLRRHHAHHHDPALMGRYNFNITFPICDWIFGTVYRPPTSVHSGTPLAPMSFDDGQHRRISSDRR